MILEPREWRYAYFRLVVPLPLSVVFPSITYHLALESIPWSNRNELHGRASHGATVAILGESYATRKFLEAAVFTYGMRIKAPTVADTIMRRLVQEGRALVVPPPAKDPLNWRVPSGHALERLRTEHIPPPEYL